MASSRKTTILLGVTALFAAAGPGSARAAVEPGVSRGVEFLRARGSSEKLGEMALAALAMLKAEVPPGDPTLASYLAKIRARFSSGGYQPERTGGTDIYEAAVVALVLANLEAEARGSDLDAVAKFLIGRQNRNGSWDYSARDKGDTSISQYAVLGLWEAENGGAAVPPEVWDRASSWFLSVQSSAGSWNYHRDEQSKFPDTLSMTAAGVGSLLICERQLGRYRRAADEVSKLVSPIAAEQRRLRYDVGTSAERIKRATREGMSWIGSRFPSSGTGTVIGNSIYYTLYGIERIGALAARDNFGRFNWFDQGRQLILRTQRGDGAWESAHGAVPNTAWAILFLTRSTAKTIRRIEVKQLGAGTLVGGRGLPTDLSNLTVAGGRVMNRPMNGAVDGMLAVLEDPRAEDAGSAASGLILRYRAEGPLALRPHKARFLKLLDDRDPGVRQLATWALGRTGDLDVAPALIGRLTDRDERVVQVAREGLQLLGRKIDGFGPPSPSTPEERREAADRWRRWYAEARPVDPEGDAEAALEPIPAPGGLPPR
jgi:hypothetical protein